MVRYFEHRYRPLFRKRLFLAWEIAGQKKTRFSELEARNNTAFIRFGTALFRKRADRILDRQRSAFGEDDFCSACDSLHLAGLFGCERLEETRGFRLACVSVREDRKDSVGPQELRESADMVAVRMSGDKRFDLPVPERDVSSQAGQEDFSASPAIDHYLVLPLLDKDGIALADIKKDDVCPSRLGMFPKREPDETADENRKKPAEEPPKMLLHTRDVYARASAQDRKLQEEHTI